MKPCNFCTFGHTEALQYAAHYLEQAGWHRATGAETADCLLLPVPSFDKDGNINGSTDMPCFPDNKLIIGGNLSALQQAGFQTLDLLQDPLYLAENAAITAHCAVSLAMTQLPFTLQRCPALVIGWGRIGKCLAALLSAMGTEVTVAARKEKDRATARALGFETADMEQLKLQLARYRVIFNTAPAPVLTEGQLRACREGCVKIDLASKRGLEGSDVIWARGLPGKDTPESSGVLIGKTVLRLMAREGIK